MIICITEILKPPELDRVLDLLSGGEFVAGADTAGWAARPVKKNQQLRASDPAHEQATQIILEQLGANPVFQSAALPKLLRLPMFNRYEQGMQYGRHVDDAIMGTPATRADVSYTIFLSPPDDYEGGELVLEDAEADHSFRLNAGDAVLYPSTYLHRVEEVRSGTRLAVVGWVQSLCRSPAHRELLFDLQQLRETEFSRNSKSPEFDLLSKTHSNLLRMFAET